MSSKADVSVISFDEINELFAEENCCGGEQLLSNLPALTFCDNK